MELELSGLVLVAPFAMFSLRHECFLFLTTKVEGEDPSRHHLVFISSTVRSELGGSFDIVFLFIHLSTCTFDLFLVIDLHATTSEDWVAIGLRYGVVIEHVYVHGRSDV